MTERDNKTPGLHYGKVSVKDLMEDDKPLSELEKALEFTEFLYKKGLMPPYAIELANLMYTSDSPSGK